MESKGAERLTTEVARIRKQPRSCNSGCTAGTHKAVRADPLAAILVWGAAADTAKTQWADRRQ